MGGCPRVKSTSLCLLEMYTVCFTHLVYNNICFLLTKNNAFLSLQVKNGGFHKNLFRKKTKIASNHTVQDNCSTIALRSFQSSSSVCVYLNNKNLPQYSFSHKYWLHSKYKVHSPYPQYRSSKIPLDFSITLKVQDLRIVLVLVPNIGLIDPETSELKC